MSHNESLVGEINTLKSSFKLGDSSFMDTRKGKSGNTAENIQKVDFVDSEFSREVDPVSMD